MNNVDLQSFYKSSAWKKLRARTVNSFLKHGRNCSWCNKPLVRGTRMIVDHTKMIRTHWHLRLEPSNLQVMHHKCHSLKTQFVDYNTKKPVDENGFPEDWQ